MKKLIFVSLMILGTMQVSAQADLGGNALMSPAVVQITQTGLLTVDVANYGFTDVTAGCALVTISVPSAISEIVGVNATSNGIWTIFNSTSMPASLTLRNTLGAIPADFINYPIILDVRGTAVGGPSTISVSVRLAGNLIQPGCLILGNLDITNDDPTTSISVQIPAPLDVKLSSFTGTMSDCRASLQWTAQSETDHNMYQVEASKDGRIFSTVGSVKAVGNSGTPLTYNYIDKKPFDGYSLYRLKMTANSGSVKYSDVVTVDNKCNTKSVRIYPNPLVENQQFGVYLSGYTGTIKGELMSMSGQLLQTFMLRNGTNTLAIKNVTQGSYMLRVTDPASGAGESFKVAVIK
jgi:hypothetical protein